MLAWCVLCKQTKEDSRPVGCCDDCQTEIHRRNRMTAAERLRKDLTTMEGINMSQCVLWGD